MAFGVGGRIRRKHFPVKRKTIFGGGGGGGISIDESMPTTSFVRENG
jgi:hypothetical protein